ncbi:SpaA isopeptide-forming pilin-related protein [Dysosmobacter sp.]|uniref:SpaA isopeptide-forming pilin-related protein n=1 Tax=Dysosmobacter sp. TaxID=2591382 RepID=UPI003AF0ADA2
MKKTWHSLKNRVTAMLLALICVLGLLPTTALAAGADTIKLERFGMSGVSYQSASLGRCTMHQMYYGVAGKTSVGFCGTKGGGMGTSLIGQTWGDPKPVTDPTVKMMMAYYYAHSLGIFTDKAHALGVDDIWDSGYSWYMNAWVQAIVWRYKDGSLGDPATACAEELMYVWNSLKGASYTSIDQTCDGATFRDRAKYILDLGKQDVWGDCDVKEYSFTGAGSAAHPASTVQSVMIGSLAVTNEQYKLVVKKVDATNPTKGLAGARFHVESTNGSFSRDIVTGADGTYTFSPLDAGTYAVTETAAPNGYEIDNAGPEYVVLPNNGSSTVTITFTDTPTVTATGKIRKVDADDPTRGLAGAVIKITGVDNNFTGTYTTGAGGALTDVPWDTMPIGSYVAEEVTPPNGYSLSKDAGKVRQEFYWDGKTDVSLVFENDAKVKIQLIKLNDANSPLPGAVFHVLRDGQLIGTEATDASGKITVPHVTEGMYAFVEVSAPAPYAKLTAPVCAHVDQATVNGGGTVTVTAKDLKLPNLTIQKLDKQTKQPIPGTVFEIKGIHYGYHQDVTTGPDGKAVLTAIPVDSYEVKETSVPAPYVVGGETIQTIYLGPGDDQNLVFENLKMPRLTVTKIDAENSKPIPGTVFTVEGIDSDFSADWTTGADGTVTDRVAPGSYKITEKSVPAPYYLPSKNADREQTVSLNAGDEVNVTFKNRKMPQLTIYKEDSVAGAPIEGAKFHITYTSSGESAEAPGTIDYGNILTDAKGEIRLHEQGKQLYPGAYTVTEVEPAPGFQMKEPSTQKIILHGSESKTLTFQNTPLNAIVVEKYDSVTHAALPGCTFQLRFLGGTSGTGGTTIGQKVTGKNGTAIWTGLTAGTYIVEEVDPADGYSIINASETIYLADSGEQSVVTVRFDNAPDGILLIRKVCSVNPSVTLANAEFKITYADGTLIGDSNGIFRTDEHGEIRVPGLKPGKSVIVTETKAPDGYIIDTQSQTVQIKEGRTVSLTFKNQPKGKLIIQKRDSATGQPLPGAEFRVTTAAGCEVGLDGVIGTSTLTQNGIFTTDGQGEIKITNLAPGAYVLTEIKAPTGYVMDSPSTNVVIGKNGDTQTVIVKNSKAGTLVIDKRDSLTGKPLQGVTFKVTTSTGEFVPAENGQISSNGLYFTDKDGKITIHGVVGTLVVTETATIPGYTIDEASRTQTVVVNPNDTQTLHFTNTPSTTLVIEKYIEGTTTPLKGVTFLVTDSSGAVVGRSNGEFITDENGRVVIHDLEPGTTVTAREVKTVEGFVLDGAPKSILIKAGEVQTLRFYNVRAGGLTVIKKDEKTGERIPGVQFEIRKMDGEIVGTCTTDENGVIYLPEAENGWYTVTELKAAEGYRLDDTPHRVEVRDGQTATLEITNKAISGILLHKVNAVTGEGIPGVSFLLYDSGNTPIAQETSDDRGYVRFENLTAGRYYLRELENEGYIPDTQKKTVYVKSGETTEIEWKNTPITGQIQVTKVSADYNAMNGWPAGTPIPNTVFEIYNARTNRLVDTIKTDKNGLAVSRPLPLARYKIVESKAAEFYGLDKTPIEVEIEYAGQIVKASMTNKSLSTNVSIKKTGYMEVMPGQLVRYNCADIATNSTTALESFYWRDTLPVKAVRLQTIYTGTWNTPGNYKIVYRTNLSGGTWRTLADNLNTSKNYVLDASPAALGLAANEYVTEFMAAFGIVPANFRQVEAPRVDCKALSKLTGGTQFVNTSDAGGVYNGQWIMATSRWVTRVYAPSKPLPRTGY